MLYLSSSCLVRVSVLQLKEALSLAFDDLSSIDDGEDDDDDSPSTEQPRRGPVLSSQESFQASGKSLTSTPRFVSDFNDKNNRFNNNNNISVIEEEALSLDADQKKDDSQSNLRLLLQENERLTTENTKLSTQVNILTGDFEGLSFKFRQLQQLNERHEEAINQLKGELAAQEISKKSHADALKAAQAKVAVAESTIDSLRSQLSEMARTDCIERLRDRHERETQKMKESFQAERLNIIQEKEALKETIEEKDRKISHLRLELEMVKKKSIQDQEARRQSSGQSEAFRRLKTELTAITDNNDNLKQEIDQLKQSLKEAKSESAFHAADSQAKQAEINGMTNEIDELKTLVQRQETEISSVKNCYEKATGMIDSLKAKLQELVNMYQSLEQENTKLEKEVADCRQTVAKLPTVDSGDELVPKSKVEEIVSNSTKEWKEQVQKEYERSFQEQLSRLKSYYQDMQQKYEERLETEVKQFVSCLKRMSEGEAIEQNLQSLRPIQDLWLALHSKYQEQMQMLSNRKDQVDEALRELENAYIDSKSEANESKHEQGILLDSVKGELEVAKEEVTQLTMKLEKYKKQYALLKASTQREGERREKHFALILKKKLEGREDNLKELISKDATLLLQQINRAYSDSIKFLKEQNDRFLEQSNTRSLEKMSQAIVSYHDLVMRKIEQRSKQLQQELLATSCEIDRDVSVLDNIPSVLLH